MLVFVLILRRCSCVGYSFVDVNNLMYKRLFYLLINENCIICKKKKNRKSHIIWDIKFMLVLISRVFT